jgi:5'-nucleotidase
MRMLVTNDDGIYSPGITALAEVATRFGEVRIVAPDGSTPSLRGTRARDHRDDPPAL